MFRPEQALGFTVKEHDSTSVAKCKTDHCKDTMQVRLLQSTHNESSHPFTQTHNSHNAVFSVSNCDCKMYDRYSKE